jgi:very-short-patch-repair endonuclease
MNPEILAAMKLPIPVMEFKFHPTRKWRLDWCFVDAKLGVEQEGGFFIQGRHGRGAGAIKDMEKYNELAILGYSLLRFTPRQIVTGECYDVIKRWFEQNGG